MNEAVSGTKEYVTINGKNYEVDAVSSGIGTLKFAIKSMPIADVVTEFSDATELSVSEDGMTPYGIYKDISFLSATVYSDGAVTVTFRIASELEIRLANLEATQDMQDGAILELANMIGGEE